MDQLLVRYNPKNYRVWNIHISTNVEYLGCNIQNPESSQIAEIYRILDRMNYFMRL